MLHKEKKIIDRINKSYDDNTQYVEASAYDWKCIVDLIDKQQKEIEELKEKKCINYYEWKHLDAIVTNNYICKDKIKSKIKDLKENNNGDDYNLINVIMILKELLDESEDNSLNKSNNDLNVLNDLQIIKIIGVKDE